MIDSGTPEQKEHDSSVEWVTYRNIQTGTEEDPVLELQDQVIALMQQVSTLKGTLETGIGLYYIVARPPKSMATVAHERVSTSIIMSIICV